MIRAFIRVVRPDDWTGRVARMGLGVLGLLALVPVMLARLPEAWVALAAGQPWLVRLVLALASLWAVAWVRALVYARLPAAPYLVGRRLVLPERGAKRRIDLAEVEEVFVQLRPPPVEQAFVARLANGEVQTICPVHWPGAGALYAAVARKLRRVRRPRG